MTGRYPLALALIAVAAPALAFLTPEGSGGTLALGWAVAAAAVATTATAEARGATNAWGRLGPLLYLVAVALLRHAEGGAASGFSPLLLLPLFWVALTEDRLELLLLLAGMVAMFTAPILLFGAPTYPDTEWRRLIIWLVAAPIVGLATQALVARTREANEQLESLARTDALTGLLNRRGFEEVAQRELVRARRTQEPVAVAMLDLDHFKRFNDAHGHPAGDALLRDAASAWRGELRDIDVLARWGGEEFIVVLPRCPGSFAHNVLDRLRAATPGAESCSIGFALWRAGELLSDTIARADVALYAAKEGGRDRVHAATAG